LSNQIAEYRRERHRYVRYAEHMKAVLEAARDLYAPLAIVQARAKTLSSFAEKAVRAAEKHPDPVHQFTDLCGARVVCDTQSEVERICEFIRQSFVIDEANSPDIRSRLATAEFGYLSVHFVVQLKKQPLFGHRVPRGVGDRKTEIQVRTLLQHAWADVGHDRVYKPQFRVPEPLKRSLARVAAVLEDADEAFGDVVEELDTYRMHYGAYMTRDEMRDEIRTLRTILKGEPVRSNKPGIALRIARIARAAWDWPTVVAELGPFVNDAGPDRAEILREHGHGLCRRYRRRTASPEYQQGQDELTEATEMSAGSAKAQALSCLAWSHEQIRGNESIARDRYRQAVEADPSDPYNLASYLEYEIYAGEGMSCLAAVRPSLESAIAVCRKHIAAGIELPWAYFAMGRFHLFLEEMDESLAAYAKGIHLCAKEETCVPPDVLDDERRFLWRINFGKRLPETHQWVDDLLLLAQCRLQPTARRRRDLADRSSGSPAPREPITVVSGGTDPSVKHEMASYEDCLLDAFKGYRGTIISGGTTAGIPGIVGKIAQRAKRLRQPLATRAYCPKSPPDGVEFDGHYTDPIHLPGRDFTHRHVLQPWIDLAATGVAPESVRVLGVNGGLLTAFEFRLALALGARVGIVESSGREASRLLSDAEGWDPASLLRLPFDPMTVRAFVNPGDAQMTPAQVRKVARSIHAAFREENRYTKVDLAMLPWSLLPEGFVESNTEQARYCEEILASVGYRLRPKSGRVRMPRFTRRQVEAMAEMEHGRFVVERLRQGWRYGPDRDPDRKISPYLVPWSALPDHVQEYDRVAVRAWPEILEKAGFEIYR
jgi:ppGpp synthetase/RelA/SpoT-type nucleotidyltranferase